MIKSSIGERIRLMRNRNGYSQESFAKICGLDRTYIAGVEKGKRNISIVNLNKIAEALNITLAELCDVSKTEKSNILLTINGQGFILESKDKLTIEQTDYIEAIGKCAYDEDSDFAEAISKDNLDRSIYDLSPYEIAELFQQIVKDKVGIDLVFKPIDSEVIIHEA